MAMQNLLGLLLDSEETMLLNITVVASLYIAVECNVLALRFLYASHALSEHS